MKDLADHLEYSKIFIIISIAIMILTYATYRMYKYKKIVKFIPGIAFIVIGLIAILTINGRIIFLDDINNFAVFVLATAAGLTGICLALILGILDKDKVKKGTIVKKFTKDEKA